MPDPNRPIAPVPRLMARVGRTPFQRAALLAVGGVAAFLLGRWSGAPEETVMSRAVRELPPSVSGTPLVIDGDTLDFDGTRVRIFGIDAFERDQLCERADGTRYGCGQMARESMMAAINNETVTCTRRDVDPYGRMVATCRTRDGDIAVHVVEDGYALAYRHYSNDYVGVEDEAHRAMRGAWEGHFMAPWDYRHKGSEAKEK